jgi:hypothetical protein
MRIQRLIMDQKIEPMNSDLLCDIAKEYTALFGYADTNPGSEARLPIDGDKLMKLTEKYFKRKNNDKQLQTLLRQI